MVALKLIGLFIKALFGLAQVGIGLVLLYYAVELAHRWHTLPPALESLLYGR